MSLPSQAIYYDKDGKEIYRYFVNVGWFLYKEDWVECVLDLPKYYKAHIVWVYNIYVPIKWVGSKKYKSLLEKLFQEDADRYNNKQNRNGASYFNKTYGRDWYRNYKRRLEDRPADKLVNQLSIMIPSIRQITPSLIAQDIVGVQPMTEPVSLFPMKSRYGSRNCIWYKLQRKWDKFKHEYNKKMIYLNSIFN